MKLIILSLSCLLLLSNVNAMEFKVNLFLTTALTSNHSESRKKEYLKSFAQFRKLGYEKPYIVEGVQSNGPTFLEEHTDPKNIFYFKGNVPTENNRGKFEGMSMLAALKHFQLPSSSIIYKQTGRYFATKDLSEIVKMYPNHDAYVKQSTEKGWILLVAFLFKAEKLQEMYENLDYRDMEQEWDPTKTNQENEGAFIENYITRYIKQAEQEKNLNLFYIKDELGVLANPVYSTTGVDPNSQTKY